MAGPLNHTSPQRGREVASSPEADPLMVIFAKMLIVNKRHHRIFAGAVCGLIALFVFFHWTRLLVSRTQQRSRSRALALVSIPFVFSSRGLRSIMIRNLPGFKSVGHAFVVAAYVAINAALTFTNVDTNSIWPLANRFGWMLSANFIVVVFLALKNTPLAFLTAYSYERLNILHQIAGYMAVLYLVLHAVTYTSYFSAHGMLFILRMDEQIAGIVAGFGFLGIFLSVAVVRHIWYEAFYVMHIACFLVAVICAAVHKPDLGTGIVIIMAVIASIWAADRLVRGLRVALYAINNTATVYPLPHGGTRIILAKKPLGVVPGKHCFVWIPRIRAMEMHPFTVAATRPMEFIVNSYDGFTRDLHDYAQKNPGAALTASVDGPYGTFPDPMEYDRVVLIAGGSGASFTFGLACNMLERMGTEAKKNITFIWSVKNHDNLTWFTDHLQTLRTHAHSPNVSVSLFVTRASPSSAANELRRGAETAVPVLHHAASSESSSTADSPTVPTGRDIEKALEAALTMPQGTATAGVNNKSSTIDEKVDFEATVAAEQQQQNHQAAPVSAPNPELLSASNAAPDARAQRNHHHHHPVIPGRPDVATLITEAVRAAEPDQRVLVASCGPDSLMSVVRNASARCIRGDGPAVELHCEQFGW